MSDESVVKPSDIHATDAPLEAAGDGEVNPLDIHATEEPVETKDIHATSEPFKPAK
ncbi:hypothetical protein RKE30_38970 [Streptomyces sp. Li-HN-5-11]|uniref:hypothetical protein n=1 Tax=Streptomyces sp. Li-HN-5-11 TaxID=3075432 RepID=UPI0028B0FBEA|nr:hypothetical protein [Streptomyces sp. Li-HN-5-11]WNM35913.1 hypothetical protein RKE30_38970 [Streptomyces sp. Li-HN-5-11]